MQPQGLSEPTLHFYELTPERILDAVERFGVRCTGRIIQLNSMENRVYEMEVEIDESQIKTPSDRFRVAKFYRPGRWSREQILEEHAFMLDLQRSEISVVAPTEAPDGSTLLEMPKEKIFFTLFPKAGGRSPDELDEERAQQIGRLIARLHNVGGAQRALRRLSLTPKTYGIDNLEFLIADKLVPLELTAQYRAVVEQIVALATPFFEGVPLQRIHGDLHFGNILWATAGPRLVDFDDMVNGPAVQDLWLMLPGRDSHARQVLEHLLSGYEQMRPFDRSTIRLIEPLRALRMIHFNAWIGRRWSDPAFQRVFSHYGTARYWAEQIADLQEQVMVIQQGGFGAMSSDEE